MPLDHLVLLVPHIDDYVGEFARVTGVTPVFGGSHPGMGTKNYLVRLDSEAVSTAGNPSYLELLGLDESQPDVAPEATMFGVGRRGPDPRPALVTWAMHPADIEATAAEAAAGGVAVGTVEAWSRTAPDGSLLRWRVSMNPALPLGGLQPFLIDWGATAHPASNPALDEIRLLGLSFETPDPEALEDALTGLGVTDPPPIRFGLAPTITASLQTPSGPLELR
nr:VOC family protein [Acidipropionibacterium thoenii]